jgi:hypothetical protein
VPGQNARAGLVNSATGGSKRPQSLRPLNCGALTQAYRIINLIDLNRTRSDSGVTTLPMC